MNIEKIIKQIYENNDLDEIKKLNKILVKSLDQMKNSSPSWYKDIEYCLYSSAYFGHLDQEVAIDWVNDMKNKDGSCGPYWQIADTDSLLNAYNLNYDRYDFFVIMNMMRSDYFTPEYSTDNYLQFARDWLDDKDVPKDKLVRYYFFVVKE